MIIYDGPDKIILPRTKKESYWMGYKKGYMDCIKGLDKLRESLSNEKSQEQIEAYLDKLKSNSSKG
jgi:hypothetical protein